MSQQTLIDQIKTLNYDKKKLIQKTKQQDKLIKILNNKLRRKNELIKKLITHEPLTEEESKEAGRFKPKCSVNENKEEPSDDYVNSILARMTSINITPLSPIKD